MFVQCAVAVGMALRTPKARGPVSAKVGLRHGKAVRVATVRTKRPSCLR